MVKRAGLPKTRRLSGRKAFARVFGGRHAAGNRLVVVYAMPNELDYARLGLTVGRRHGSAVRRNQIKRLLREAFRLSGDRMPRGYDLVCVPRVGPPTVLEAYQRALVSAAERAVMRYEQSRNKPDEA